MHSRLDAKVSREARKTGLLAESNRKIEVTPDRPYAGHEVSFVAGPPCREFHVYRTTEYPADMVDQIAKVDCLSRPPPKL